MSNPPRVFISYSHDSEEHRERVLQLANRLRREGIDADIDRYYEDVPLPDDWLEQQIELAEFVLVACTLPYYGIVRMREKGQEIWEDKYIITEQIYQRYRTTTQFLLIGFSPRQDKDPIPDFLLSSPYYNVNNITEYEGLYRQLTNQPMLVAPPPMGPIRALPVQKEDDEPFDYESTGGLLTSLEMQGVGPAKHLVFEPGERLNLITGDNGLGKTFLLECAWWALTRQWPDHPAFPRQDAAREEPQISFRIAAEASMEDQASVAYNWETQSWPVSKRRRVVPGLCLYARVDGSFAFWDPAREYESQAQGSRADAQPFPPVLTREQIWNGLAGPRSGNLINGLIADWVLWQNNPKRYPQFAVFQKVLACLSPPQRSDLGVLEPGNPQRLPFDSREIPTVKHPYGEVPIIHASAGVRRILTLAYILVWAWTEHRIHSELIRREPQNRLILLIDELEAHLHPQWQRVILPALLAVQQHLADQLKMQFLIATHAPLVIASAEPEFDDNTDKLFHLNLADPAQSNEVVLREVPFTRYGRADSWLMSEVFALKQPRSLEAEKAIEEAKAVQAQKRPTKKRIEEVSARLMKCLGTHDEFWPHWLYFAEQHGVEL